MYDLSLDNSDTRYTELGTGTKNWRFGTWNSLPSEHPLGIFLTYIVRYNR